MSNLMHTPGPWRWEFNKTSKSVYLVGGKPRFDKTVMQFGRWGMGHAVPLFNSHITGNQYNIMERLCDQPEWTKPFPDFEHHATWRMDVIHPDAVLMAAAPDLLADLREAATTLRRYEKSHRAKGTADSTEKAEVNASLAARFEATIAKATGITP